MKKRCVAFAAAAWLASAGMASAQIGGQAGGFASSAELEQVFQQLLADPANPELTLRYARLAVEAGNSEAAVAALERLVLFNDTLPRARIELGVLYYRLGSHAQARDYLKRGLADPSLPADARANGERYLAEVENMLSPHVLEGSLTMGFRYQTNANLAPSGRRVFQAGLPFNLPRNQRKQEDGNFFGLLGVEHRYDFDPFDRQAWLESDFTLYGAKQFERSRLDLMVADFATGPRFQPLPGELPGLNMKPFFRASVAVLDEQEYFHSLGFGLSNRLDLSERLRIEGTYEFRALDYNSTSRRPFADEQSGIENNLSVGARYLITPSQRIEFRLGGRLMDAEKGYESFDEISASLTYQFGYAAPFAGMPQWIAAAFAGYAHSWYDRPDRSVLPGRKRDDDEWRIGAYNVFNLSKDWSALALIEYVENDSNIRNFDYNDLSIMIGVTRRF